MMRVTRRMFHASKMVYMNASPNLTHKKVFRNRKTQLYMNAPSHCVRHVAGRCVIADADAAWSVSPHATRHDVMATPNARGTGGGVGLTPSRRPRPWIRVLKRVYGRQASGTCKFGIYRRLRPGGGESHHPGSNQHHLFIDN